MSAEQAESEIQAAFDDLVRAVHAGPLQETQYKECRRFFFAGVVWATKGITDSHYPAARAESLNDGAGLFGRTISRGES